MCVCVCVCVRSRQLIALLCVCVCLYTQTHDGDTLYVHGKHANTRRCPLRTRVDSGSGIVFGTINIKPRRSLTYILYSLVARSYAVLSSCFAVAGHLKEVRPLIFRFSYLFAVIRATINVHETRTGMSAFSWCSIENTVTNLKIRVYVTGRIICAPDGDAIVFTDIR